MSAVVDPGQQSVGLGPRGVGGVSRDRVQPDAEAQLAAGVGGELADTVELEADILGPLAPREVDVRVAGGHPSGSRRGSAEVDQRLRVGDLRQRRVLDAQVLALERHGLAVPEPADDLEELVAAPVPVVLVEEVAEHPLLVALAAGDDVQEQAAAGQVLEGAGHLGGQERRRQPGPERDQELQPLRERAEHGGRDPGVLAPGPGRRQCRLEAELLGAAGDLAEVGHRRRSPGRAGLDPVAAADDLASVAAVGGQEPVELQHGCSLLRVLVIEAAAGRGEWRRSPRRTAAACRSRRTRPPPGP